MHPAQSLPALVPSTASFVARAIRCYRRSTFLVLRPTFAAGYVLRLAIAVAAKEPASLALLEETLLAGERAQVAWSARERAHLSAARAWLCGKPDLTADRYATILRAIADFAAGVWPAAAAQLRPLLPSLAQLGGSRAQHEIFARMLRHAQARCHDAEMVVA